MGAVKNSCVCFFAPQEFLPAHGAHTITAIYPQGKGCWMMRQNAKLYKTFLQPADITSNYRKKQNTWLM